MKQIFKLLIVLLSILNFNLSASQETTTLNQEEISWIRNNQVITIAVVDNYPPYDFRDNHNKLIGFHSDIVKEINKNLGTNIVLKPFKLWKDAYNAAIKGKVHGIFSLSWSKEREDKFFNYSSSYHFTPYKLIVKKQNSSINSLDDIKNRKIAVATDTIFKDIVQEKAPSAKIVFVDDTNKAYQSVQNGKTLATIAQNKDNELLDKYGLKVVSNVYHKSSNLYIGSSKKYSTVTSILTKGIDSISLPRLSKLRKKWFDKKERTIELTKEEKIWLKEHPNIVLGADQNWQPFDFKDRFGKHAGFDADYIDLLRKKLGLNIKIELGKWGELQDKVKNKKLAGLVASSKSNERDKYMTFTKPYFMIIEVILLRNDMSISSINDLDNKTLALNSGSSDIEYFKKKFPKIKLKIFKTQADIIRAVSLGEVDAGVSNVGAASYEMKRNFISNVKVGFEIDEIAGDMRFGIRKDWPQLASILQKGIDAITREELNKILNRWLKLAISQNKTTKIDLSNEEKKWLNEHKNIKFTADPNYLPYEAFDKNGNYTGMVADYLKIIEKTLNINFEKIPTKSWSESLEKSKSKEVDVLSNYTVDNSLKDIQISTKPYIISPISIITKEDIKNGVTLEKLKNKKIAVIKGYGYLENIFKKYPKLNYIEVDNAKIGLKGVSSGKYDAVICSLTLARYTINEFGLYNLHMAGQTGEVMQLGLGVRKDWKTFVNILNKVIDTIPKGTKQEITKKWVGDNISNEKKISLSQNEKAWLEKNKSLSYVYDIDWAPFEWKNELGEHTGIIYDILSLIEQRSGIKFNQVSTNSWSQAVDMMKNDKADMYSGIGENEDRKKYLNFTKNTIFKTPYVFVSRANDKNDYLETFRVIENKKVAVVDGYTIHGILKDKKPNLPLLTVKTIEEGFEKVRDKQLDIFIVNAASAKYYINRKGFDDLKIATKTEFNLELKIAVQKELPKEALSILDKSIESLSPKEISDIYFKWTEVLVKDKTDWVLIGEISGAIALLILFILWNNYKLKSKVKEKTKDLQNVLDSMEVTIYERTQELNDEKNFINTIMNSQENFVITSDGKCLKTANKAFYDFYDVKDTEEFMEKFGACICDTFDTTAPKEYIQKMMGDEKWLDYVHDRPAQTHKALINRDGKDYIFTITSEKLTVKGEEIKTAIFTDITKIEKVKQEVEGILANILLPVLITSKKDRVILYANKYAEQQYEKTLDEIVGSSIDDVYTIEGQHQHILDDIKKYGRVENSEEIFKTSSGKEFNALLSVTPVFYNDEDCYIGMVTDITKQKEMENEVRAIHKHTRESIEYASLIQGALIPQKGIMESFFKDQFVTWIPKDTVGGDIWLFNELRHEDECLLFFIDCTGHGVPGAFVTMIVKSIEREIVSNLKKHPEFDISPAIIMGYFNNTMKTLLKQDTKDSLSNAGWDGGIIYYNRRTQILKFSGAETPLFYIDENEEFQTVKGTRYSVGYKKCAMDYEYKETIINVKEGMKFYCTTDGYLDQNGGEKDFPFGKKRFANIIKENHKEPMAELQNIFMKQMLEYENAIANNDRNDDITVIAFEIGAKSDTEENTIEEIVKYEGVMTQNVIASTMDNIESKIENMGTMGIVSTITIEYCQNMMNYSKGIRVTDLDNIISAGKIEVQLNKDSYKIIAKNILNKEDKEKIEPKLIEIQGLDKAGIKKRYRELRKSGQNTHEKGGGIGMYEIAKVSDSIEYNFEAINDDKYYFTMKSIVKNKVREKKEI